MYEYLQEANIRGKCNCVEYINKTVYRASQSGAGQKAHPRRRAEFRINFASNARTLRAASLLSSIYHYHRLVYGVTSHHFAYYSTIKRKYLKRLPSTCLVKAVVVALPPLLAALLRALLLLRPDLLLPSNTIASLTRQLLTLLLSRLLLCSRAPDPVFSARWPLPPRELTDLFLHT